jgi:hypothetical protein
MPRLFQLTVALVLLFSIEMTGQSRIKGKRTDTTQTVLSDDTTVKKLIVLKDSMAKIGPESKGPRKPESPDQTGMIVLIIGSLLVIIWAGRRAWLRQRKS